MSGLGEVAAAVGLGLNVRYHIDKRLNPSKIYKYAERKVNSLDNEVMLAKLLERDLKAGEHVHVLRQRAEASLKGAAMELENTNVLEIRSRLLASRAAYAKCKQYEDELVKRSAVLSREYNDKQLQGADRKGLNSPSQLSVDSACAIEEFSALDLNSSIDQIFTIEEHGEVSSGPGGLLLVQVNEETNESVRQDDTPRFRAEAVKL
ncbi:hypothetical protein BDP27DRAFT_1357162 [Rhodocollybia butyracea]|uniref:Uncharacterized protein n=1 Tax=Rhodocollybia butyracea TaxID=206335 RepID=A0A9P5QAL9_9AGAR|nr:hypothetical protein BDP27DRAFT_1357162 [Rhodocollybia butyracea]